MLNRLAELERAAADLAGRTSADGNLLAEPLVSWPWMRVATGGGSLFIVLPAVGGPPLPDRRYEHVSVRFNVDCSLHHGGVARLETLTLVECGTTDPTLRSLFLKVAAVILPNEPGFTGADLAEAIGSLVELFRILNRPPRTTQLGLWGEMFLLSNSSDPEVAVAAWHSTPEDRYDFAAQNLRVEVKTSSSERRHHFSLEQLTPPAGVSVLVASLLTIRSNAGPSIDDMVTELASRVHGSVRSHLVATAMASLGAGWAEGSRARYDSGLASETLRWYASGSILRPAEPPLGVSQVKFVSDLQLADSLEPGEVTVTGTLLDVLAPPSRGHGH